MQGYEKTSISNNVMILCTKYDIIKKKYEEDEVFKKRGIDGWCSSCKKEIVYCDASTNPAFENENDAIELELYEKEVVRHEIVHAFFSECGLRDSALINNIAWCKNEELVDWIASMARRIHSAFIEAGVVGINE